MVKSSLIILLLSSQGFSFSLALFGLFVPNDKLVSLGFIFSSLLFGSSFLYKKDLYIFLFLGTSLLFISIVHLFFGNLFRANLNIAYTLFVIPFFSIWVNKNVVNFLPAFQVVVLINLLVSFFQQISLQLNQPELSTIFNNYYSQVNYLYPEVNGVFRTSGLFTESSQYSIFLALYLYSFINFNFNKSYIIFFLAIFDIILNQSVLGYISLLVIVLFRYKFSYKIIFVLPLAFYLLISQWDKIVFTLSLYNPDSFPRFASAIFNISNTMSISPIYGLGLTWNNPSWDIFSVMIKGFGIVGLIACFVFLLYISSITNLTLFFIFFLNLVVNGNLAIPINIFFLSFIFYNYFSKFKVSHYV